MTSIDQPRDNLGQFGKKSQNRPAVVLDIDHTTFTALAGKQARNYCTLPTIDVPIVEEIEFHCEGCGGTLASAGQNSIGLTKWVHEDEPECEGHESLDGAHMGEAVYCDGTCVKHSTSVRPTCEYCGSDEQMTEKHYSWYDALECGRCGGVTGFALGD